MKDASTPTKSLGQVWLCQWPQSGCAFPECYTKQVVCRAAHSSPFIILLCMCLTMSLVLPPPLPQQDPDWLRRIRRWPPVMAERMAAFISLSGSQGSAQKLA